MKRIVGVAVAAAESVLSMELWSVHLSVVVAAAAAVAEVIEQDG